MRRYHSDAMLSSADMPVFLLPYTVRGTESGGDTALFALDVDKKRVSETVSVERREKRKVRFVIVAVKEGFDALLQLLQDIRCFLTHTRVLLQMTATSMPASTLNT